MRAAVLLAAVVTVQPFANFTHAVSIDGVKAAGLHGFTVEERLWRASRAAEWLADLRIAGPDGRELPWLEREVDTPVPPAIALSVVSTQLDGGRTRVVLADVRDRGTVPVEALSFGLRDPIPPRAVTVSAGGRVIGRGVIDRDHPRVPVAPTRALEFVVELDGAEPLAIERAFGERRRTEVVFRAPRAGHCVLYLGAATAQLPAQRLERADGEIAPVQLGEIEPNHAFGLVADDRTPPMRHRRLWPLVIGVALLIGLALAFCNPARRWLGQVLQNANQRYSSSRWSMR
jgi:hypothetical protein